MRALTLAVELDLKPRVLAAEVTAEQTGELAVLCLKGSTDPVLAKTYF